MMEVLLRESLQELCLFVQGTKAASHIDLSSEKTAASIRSVVASYIEPLEHLEDSNDPFSIKAWMENEDEEGWLFLSTNIAQRATMTPLISSWFSIAIRSILQMEENLNRRIWFIADELPSLQKIKDFEVFVTESRKFGGCGLFAIQSPAQLEIIYGRELAKVILGNCMTRIAFYEQNPQIAEYISREFGEKELKEIQEGVSYGAHEMRDGVSLSTHTKVKRVISPAEIQSLEKNNAFVRLPESHPITKIKLKIAQPEHFK